MKKTNFFIIILLILLSFQSTDAKNFKKKNIENTFSKYEYLNIDWWKKFEDPILLGHLETLYDKNHDLKIANLKVKQSQQQIKLALSNQLPQISLNSNINRTFNSSNQQFGPLIIDSYNQNNFLFPLNASWEIDLWGINRLKTKSFESKSKIMEQNEKSVYIILTSFLATDYFNLILTDKLLELQNQLIAIQKEIESKIKIKYENGLCNLNDLLTQQKKLTSYIEELNNLEEKRDLIKNQLKVYLVDSSINHRNYDDLFLPPLPSLEYKTDIIENRPDFINAEKFIQTIGYDVKIAKKEFLPKITIYGELGFNAYNFSKIFKSYSQLANIGLIPSFDIFSGGKKFAFLKLKKYEYEEALENYQKTILTSIQDINDSLFALKIANKNYLQSNSKSKLENQTYLLMLNKKDFGAISNLDTLYYRENLIESKKSEAISKINYIISTISLYKALGGVDIYEINNFNNI